MAVREREREKDIEIEEVPAEREYERESTKELDAALVNAIEKAESDDNKYLSQLLRSEIRSLYYGDQLGL